MVYTKKRRGGAHSQLEAIYDAEQLSEGLNLLDTRDNSLGWPNRFLNIASCNPTSRTLITELINKCDTLDADNKIINTETQKLIASNSALRGQVRGITNANLLLRDKIIKLQTKSISLASPNNRSRKNNISPTNKRSPKRSR